MPGESTCVGRPCSLRRRRSFRDFLTAPSGCCCCFHACPILKTPGPVGFGWIGYCGRGSVFHGCIDAVSVLRLACESGRSRWNGSVISFNRRASALSSMSLLRCSKAVALNRSNQYVTDGERQVVSRLLRLMPISPIRLVLPTPFATTSLSP